MLGHLIWFILLSMPHGVDSIYKNYKTKSNIDGGRWFLNMTLVSSHR